MRITLPDGSFKELESSTTALDLATTISKGLGQGALVAKVNGAAVDLSRQLNDGDSVEIVTDKSPGALEYLRHSASHVMAAAIRALYPNAQFGVGPDIEDGFYYDILLDRPLSSDDFQAIESKMGEIIAAGLPFQRSEVSEDEAREIFADQHLKLELIDDFTDGETISVYRLGDFVDLCRGPHVPSSTNIKAFKLMRIAGAYWRGDSEREVMQRLYGTAWFSEADQTEYLTRIEEAEKRDHRRLGRELGIYITDERAGIGLPLYQPAGARVIRIMQEWLRRDLYKRGYQEVITPHIYNADLWKISGHYDFYHENMYFFEIDESEEKDLSKLSEFAIKPMNCPGHVLLYDNELRSYRDLPLRYFEFGTVYRHEMSGAVHGLLRARGFTQDDAHIFCTQDQVIDEVLKMLDIVDFIMETFGFTYYAEISTRPEMSIGDDDKWEYATESLMEACRRHGLEFDINEGDGAFYGPKIDIKVRDAIGRYWQCSTIQVDFNFPERFNLTYRTADNSEAQPWMLHRAIFGSIERFLGILIEHYSGALPLWLAPVQVAIIPVSDKHLDYASVVRNTLEAVGGRVAVYDQNEPMRAKIAKAQIAKVPYMLVVGDKESAEKTVSVRERSQGDLGAQDLDGFAQVIKDSQI
ncbi:MAG: threonine--tRNA ligase [Coriobacteriia bacterium]|nr:threonine--tRNA ligase [Coriobacteriia bacterium]